MAKRFIYVDGGSRNNGSPDAIAAWAVNMYDENNHKLIEFGDFKLGGTNNQMELTALYWGLNLILKSIEVDKVEHEYTIFQDSHYAVEGANNWMFNWVRNHNLHSKANSDIWQLIYDLRVDLQRRGVRVEIREVRGHSGVEGNESVDAHLNKIMDSEKTIGFDDHHLESILNKEEPTTSAPIEKAIRDIPCIQITDVVKLPDEVIISYKQESDRCIHSGMMKFPSYLIKKLLTDNEYLIERNLDGDYICPICGDKLTLMDGYLYCNTCVKTFEK